MGCIIYRSKSFLEIIVNISLSSGYSVAQFIEVMRCSRKLADLVPDGVTGIFH